MFKKYLKSAPIIVFFVLTMVAMQSNALTTYSRHIYNESGYIWKIWVYPMYGEFHVEDHRCTEKNPCVIYPYRTYKTEFSFDEKYYASNIMIHKEGETSYLNYGPFFTRNACDFIIKNKCNDGSPYIISDSDTMSQKVPSTIHFNDDADGNIVFTN